MATNNILQVIGTAIIVADSSYSPGTNTTLGSRTDDIDVVGLTAGQARESVKINLLTPHAALFSVDMSVEMASDPAAGDLIDLYWSESHSATAAVGNMGNVTGADADWAGAVGQTLAESLAQMLHIGSFNLGVQNNADGVQIGHVGIFAPVQQYGVLVWHNNSGVVVHSDSIECAVRLTPIIPDIAAEA